MGEVRPFEVARTGPREGGGAPVYGPVLGTPATPEAVGGLGRRVWLLRTARAQRAREAPPLGRGRGVIFELRYELLYCTHFFRPRPPYCTVQYNARGGWGMGDGVIDRYSTVL